MPRALGPWRPLVPITPASTQAVTPTQPVGAAAHASAGDHADAQSSMQVSAHASRRRSARHGASPGDETTPLDRRGERAARLLVGFDLWFEAKHPDWRETMSAHAWLGGDPHPAGDRPGTCEAQADRQTESLLPGQRRYERAVDPAIMTLAQRGAPPEADAGASWHAEQGIADALRSYHTISNDPGSDTARADALTKIRSTLVALQGHRSAAGIEPALPPVYAQLLGQIDRRIDTLMTRAPRIMHFTWIGEIPEIAQDYMLLHLAVNGRDYQYRLWHDPDASLAPALRKAITRYAATSEAVFPSSEHIAHGERFAAGNEKAVAMRAVTLQNMAWRHIDAEIRAGRTFDEAAADFMVDRLGAAREDLDAIRTRASQSVNRLTDQARALGLSVSGEDFEVRSIRDSLLSPARGLDHEAPMTGVYFRELAQRTNPASAAALSALSALHLEGGLHLAADVLPELVPALANAGREQMNRMIYQHYAAGVNTADDIASLAAEVRYATVLDRFPELLPARDARKSGYSFNSVRELVRKYGVEGGRLAATIEREIHDTLRQIDTSESVARAVFAPMGERRAGTHGFAYTAARSGYRTYLTSNSVLAGRPGSDEIAFILDAVTDQYGVLDERPGVMLNNPDREALEQAVDLAMQGEAADEVVPRTNVVPRFRANAEPGRPAMLHAPAVDYLVSPRTRFDGLLGNAEATAGITGPGALARFDRAYRKAVTPASDEAAARHVEATLQAEFRRLELEDLDRTPADEEVNVIEFGDAISTEEAHLSASKGSAATRPNAMYGQRTAYDHTVILQVGNDQNSAAAARFLYNRHHKAASWVRLRAQGNLLRYDTIMHRERVFLTRDARVRVTVVGLGEAEVDGVPTRMSGHSGDQVARAIASMQGEIYPASVGQMRISIVGCDMRCGFKPTGGEVGPGFVRDLMTRMPRILGAPVDATARSGTVAVDVLGRKSLFPPMDDAPTMKWRVEVDAAGRVRYRSVSDAPTFLRARIPAAGAVALHVPMADVILPPLPRLTKNSFQSGDLFALGPMIEHRATRTHLEANIWERRVQRAMQEGQHPGVIGGVALLRLFGYVQAVRSLVTAVNTARAKMLTDPGQSATLDSETLARIYFNAAQGAWELGSTIPPGLVALARSVNLNDIRSEEPLSRLSSKVLAYGARGISGGFAGANVGFGVYELMYASKEDYAQAATQLALDTLIFGTWVGETAAAYVGSEAVAAAFAEGGIVLGAITFLVSECFTAHKLIVFATAQEAQVSRYLRAYDDGLASGGMRLSENGTALVAMPSVVIRKLDLATGQVHFGGPLISTRAGAGRFAGPQAMSASPRAGEADIEFASGDDDETMRARGRQPGVAYLRDLLHRPESAELPAHNASIVILPITPESGIDFEQALEAAVLRRMLDGCAAIGITPGTQECNAAAGRTMAMLRDLQFWMGERRDADAAAQASTSAPTRMRRAPGPSFDGPAARDRTRLHFKPVFDPNYGSALISSMSAVPERTSVEVILDRESRVLVTPPLPDQWLNLLSYRLVGGGSPTVIVPTAGANYTLVDAPDARGSWTIDARNVTQTDPALRRVGRKTEIGIGGARFIAENPNALIYIAQPDGRRQRIDASTGTRYPAGIDVSSASKSEIASRLRALSVQAQAGQELLRDQVVPIDGLRDSEGESLRVWYAPITERFAMARKSREAVALCFREEDAWVWVYDPAYASISAQLAYELRWMDEFFDDDGRLFPQSEQHRAGFEHRLPYAVVAAGPQASGSAWLRLSNGVRLTMTSDDSFFVTGVSGEWADAHADDIEYHLSNLATAYETTSMIVVDAVTTPGREAPTRYYDLEVQRLVSIGALSSAPDARYLGLAQGMPWALANGELHRVPSHGPIESMGPVESVTRNRDRVLIHGWRAAPGQDALVLPALAGVNTTVLAFDEGTHRLRLDIEALNHYDEIEIDAFSSGAPLSLRIEIDLPLMGNWDMLGHTIDGDDVVLFAPGRYDASLGAVAMVRVVDGARMLLHTYGDTHNPLTDLLAGARADGVGLGEVFFEFPRSNFAARPSVQTVALMARSLAELRRGRPAPSPATTSAEPAPQ